MTTCLMYLGIMIYSTPRFDHSVYNFPHIPYEVGPKVIIKRCKKLIKERYPNGYDGHIGALTCHQMTGGPITIDSLGAWYCAK